MLGKKTLLEDKNWKKPMGHEPTSLVDITGVLPLYQWETSNSSSSSLRFLAFFNITSYILAVYIQFWLLTAKNDTALWVHVIQLNEMVWVYSGELI